MAEVRNYSSAAKATLKGWGVERIGNAPLRLADVEACEALVAWRESGDGPVYEPKVSRKVVRRAEQWVWRRESGSAPLVEASNGAAPVGDAAAALDALGAALAARSAGTADSLGPNAVRQVEDIALSAVEAAGLDAAKLQAAIRSELDLRPPMRIEVADVQGDLPPVRHERFRRIMWLAANLPNIYLVGPAGTGKSTLGEQVAATLPNGSGGQGRPFLGISCSAGLGESALLGRWLPVGESGTWEYVIAAFVKAYRDGGVILLDEVDAADSNLLVVINAALANGHLNVPGYGRVERHADTVIICAANTYGTGPDASYVGREALDAATLDRFVGAMVEVDYSDAIEAAICGLDPLPEPEPARSVPVSAAIAGEQAFAWVREMRRKVAAAGLRRIVSTRALTAYIRHAVAGEMPAFFESFFCGWTSSEREAVA